MPPPTPIDALTAQVNGLQTHVTDLQTALAGHKTRLEQALTALAAASANGANVPQLITNVAVVATQLQATIDAIKSWSDNETSQTYVNGLLPH